MNVKRIIGSTMPEVMGKVKAELGEDAVILQSRIIYTGGFLGLFKKKKFEVVAAVDDQQTIHPPKEKIHGPAQHAEQKKLLNEIEHLKQLVAEHNHIHPELKIYPEPIQGPLRALQKQGVRTEYITEIGEALLEKWRSSQDFSALDMLHETKVQLQEKIAAISVPYTPYRKKFICLVGPTGVGKTTTLAKLAAEAMLEQKKKIAFITIDTYRIAAIEQLKTYANLLHVPVEVAYDENDFLKAAEKLEGYDHVFIDTAGRNFRDVSYVNSLEKFLANEQNLETFLVLSVSMKENGLEKIIENFQPMNIRHFIFTKLDETDSYGTMVNMMLKYRVAAAYLTIGQDVPDDMIAATSETIAGYLIGEMKI